MFCTLRNLSPPIAASAALAKSSGLASAVIATAGIALASPELPLVLAGCPWPTAKFADPTINKKNQRLLFIKHLGLKIYERGALRSSTSLVRRFVDCPLPKNRHHQSHQNYLGQAIVQS